MTLTNRSFGVPTLAIGLVLILVACNGTGNQQATIPDAEPSEKTAEPEQAEAMKELSIKEQIIASQADLAERLGIEKDEVGLSGATPVNWRSGALGCPEPGMSYTQVLVPGIWIMMKVGNKAYRYHAVIGGPPFFCPDERAEPPAVSPGMD